MKIDQPQVAVVVPIYNENTRIVHTVIEDIVQHGYTHVVVVDDGSLVPFQYEGEQKNVVVIRHCLNRGKGAALKTGIEYAKKHNFAACVTLDGDGQHKASDVDQFIQQLDEGKDVVLGYRTYKTEVMPVFKVFANSIANIVTYMACGMWVRDSQCGFRAYNSKALEYIDTRTDGYEYESEVIREIQKYNLAIAEVPIITHYSTYASTKHVRQSFVRGIKTFFSILLFHRSP